MKRFGLFLIAGLLVALGVWWYVFNKPHKDYAGMEASLTCTAEEVADHVAGGSLAANAVIIVSGEIKSTEANAPVLLHPNLSITMDSTFAQWGDLQAGQEVTLKARFLGYNDLFEEYEFDYGTVEP